MVGDLMSNLLYRCGGCEMCDWFLVALRSCYGEMIYGLQRCARGSTPPLLLKKFAFEHGVL